MGIVVVCGLLAVPLGHQVIGHRALHKSLRAVGFHRHHGPEVPTPHEHRHRYKTRAWQLATDAAWYAYIAGAVLVGIVLR